jgi:hypothetical protein
MDRISVFAHLSLPMQDASSAKVAVEAGTSAWLTVAAETASVP